MQQSPDQDPSPPPPPKCRWRCGGSRDLSSPCGSGVCPLRPEPSLPGTAERPATISRLLIPRDKSRSLMPPEEEKRRALGREQQTRRWIRCSLPAWVSHEFPRVTRGGTEPGGAGGTRCGDCGELLLQGLGSARCLHPPAPARPSQQHSQAAGAGLWHPGTHRVTSCHHRCKAAFERCQVTTEVPVLSKAMAPGSPVPSV